MKYSILILIGVSLLTALCAVPNTVAQDNTIQAERYFPDPSDLFPATPDPADDARAPYPERERVIEADKIVLRGREVLIVITAEGDNPGILMQHRSGYAQHLYFRKDGKAVIGVRSPGQKHFSSAIWANRNTGVLQMRGPHGVYVMEPKNLYQGAR